MSAGPIAQERAGHKVAPTSTVDTHRACAAGAPGHGYCGRQADKLTTADWALVRCVDCDAARRADAAAREFPRTVW